MSKELTDQLQMANSRITALHQELIECISRSLEYRSNVIHLTNRGNELHQEFNAKIQDLEKQLEDLKKSAIVEEPQVSCDFPIDAA
jgi:septal ring factor EnvC (AmiA/AmiB activator)